MLSVLYGGGMLSVTLIKVETFSTATTLSTLSLRYHNVETAPFSLSLLPPILYSAMLSLSPLAHSLIQLIQTDVTRR